MLKKFLLAKTSQGQKKKRFVSYTAKSIIVFILILAVFLLAGEVLAITLEVGLEYAKATGLGTEDIRITVAKIIRAALGFLGILAVVIIIYGGFKYMTSGGDPEKIDKAKKIIRDAVIGLLIILSSFAIVSFILQALLQTIYGPGYGAPSYGAGGGALGNGIIESHYPPRNALGIPRNTSIVVTFKVPMAVNTIVNDRGTADNLLDDLIQPASVKIHKTGEAVNVTNVRASYTKDLKTFVFKPYDLLGDADQPTNYTVELTSNIKKFDGSDAFGAYGGYFWSFEVSTIVDLTPPQIVSVIPRPVIPIDDRTQAVPRNHIVQINFNEPINPMTISGITELAGGGAVEPILKAGTFDYINVLTANNNFVAGQFMYGNQYKTVEFVTNDLCGKNSCGDDVFCLPANEKITVLAKAATLDGAGPTALFPYTGIVDMADNSLDGNKDGQASGPGISPYYINDQSGTGDHSKWTFWTNDLIDLNPPEIKAYQPKSAETEVEPRTKIGIILSKLIMATTLKPDRGYGDGYCLCREDASCGVGKCDLARSYCLNKEERMFVCTESIPRVICPAQQECQEKHHLTLKQPSAEELISKGFPGGGWAYWIESINNEELTQTTAIINHAPLGEDLKYGVIVGSGVKDLLQNCFMPCADGQVCIKAPKPGGKVGEYIEGSKWEGVFPSCELP